MAADPGHVAAMTCPQDDARAEVEQANPKGKPPKKAKK